METYEGNGVSLRLRRVGITTHSGGSDFSLAVAAGPTQPGKTTGILRAAQHTGFGVSDPLAASRRSPFVRGRMALLSPLRRETAAAAAEGRSHAVYRQAAFQAAGFEARKGRQLN